MSTVSKYQLRGSYGPKMDPSTTEKDEEENDDDDDDEEVWTVSINLLTKCCFMK
jgi:hypothetical protein